MEILVKDIRYCLRSLLKRPGFSSIAVITLALGIGANTAILSVYNSVLLRPLPYPDSDRLVQLWPQGAPASVSKADFVNYRKQSQMIERVAAFSGWSFTLTGTDEPEKLEGARTTADFFSVLGVKPLLGRSFSPEEEQPGRANVMVIGYGLWQRRFGSDKSIVGRTLTLDGLNHTVIGVMPADFRFPDRKTDLWVPAPLDPAQTQDYRANYLQLIARLKPDVTREQSQEELRSLATGWRSAEPQRYAASYGVNATVVDLRDQLVGKVHLALIVLLGAVGLVLLIAFVNVANLQLARALSRRQEFSVRLALGASRGRLVRLMLTESILLAAMGAIAGIGLALYGTDLLRVALPAEMPRLNEIKVDPFVLGFALLLSLLTGLLFGLAPAIQASRPQLYESLREAGRNITASRRRLRNLLVVSEVALAVVLMTGAGLLVKSFWHLRHVDSGFKSDHVLSLQISPPDGRFSSDETTAAQQIRTLYQQIFERFEAQPGVETVGAIHLQKGTLKSFRNPKSEM